MLPGTCELVQEMMLGAALPLTTQEGTRPTRQQTSVRVIGPWLGWCSFGCASQAVPSHAISIHDEHVVLVALLLV